MAQGESPEGKGTRGQGRQPKFNLWGSHGGGKEPTPPNCPLLVTCMPWFSWTYTHILQMPNLYVLTESLTCSCNTLVAEAVGCHSKLQASQGYVARPCLRKTKTKQKATENQTILKPYAHDLKISVNEG